ncbi:MAG: acyl-CoA dehydrogenase family protein [Polyangiales bacterium]
MPARADIEWGEDAALLAKSASELLAARWDFAAVRRAMQTEDGFDRALYREMAQLGWLGAAVPEAYGGAGMGAGVLCGVVEPMGQRVFGSPFLASTLAAQVLLVAGNPEQKQHWLPLLVRGDAIGTLALSEPSGSYELDLSAAAQITSGGYVLSGTKTFVLDAQSADLLVIAARLGERPALFVVESEQLAGRLQRELLIDETRRSSRLVLDGLTLERQALLDGGDAVLALERAWRIGTLLVAAEMSGGAEGVMQLTLDYLKTRKQFGQPIGSYQALKHPMVEIMCAIEQGRSLLYHAATLLDRDDPETEVALRMAKAQLGDTYAYAADRAIQFHGAIGFTYECNAQLFFRRAQWAQHTFGDPRHHLRHLASLLWCD